MTGIWNKDKATKVFELLGWSNMLNKWMNKWWLLIDNHECIFKFTHCVISEYYFERCQIGCIDRLWNTDTIPVRDVPFERKCKCTLKGTTMNAFSNLPTMLFRNIPLRDARLSCYLRDVIWELQQYSFERLSFERCNLRHTSILIREIVFWQMLFEIYKNIHLGDCLLRDVLWEIQKYSFDICSFERCY